jgi:multidrug efflux pump
VKDSVAFPDYRSPAFQCANASIVFITLKDFNERKGRELSAAAIAGALNQSSAAFRMASSSCCRRRLLGLGTMVVSR